jgi:hypothetical protein
VIPTIRIHGVPEALRAFDQLPRRVRFKHLRIALNAGGGVIRDAYKARAHRETGLLSKSIGVKVTIPDASFNKAHHGKPATAVIGVKRKAGRMMRLNKKNALKSFGLAQRELVAERKRLTKDGKLPPLKRERAAVKAVLDKNREAVYRNPARYAHLAGPRRKGAEVLAAAVRASKSQAIARVSEKLRQGIEIEARSLAGAGA